MWWFEISSLVPEFLLLPNDAQAPSVLVGVLNSNHLGDFLCPGFLFTWPPFFPKVVLYFISHESVKTDPYSLLWHVGSRSSTRNRTQAPLHLECEVLATGPPGKSPKIWFLKGTLWSGNLLRRNYYHQLKHIINYFTLNNFYYFHRQF